MLCSFYLASKSASQKTLIKKCAWSHSGNFKTINYIGLEVKLTTYFLVPSLNEIFKILYQDSPVDPLVSRAVCIGRIPQLALETCILEPK